MIVKCIKEDEHEYLGLNRTYFVYGIQYEEGQVYYCILPFEDDREWYRFNSEYFQVIDETIPTNWTFGTHEGYYRWFTISYEEAATDEDHYEKLFDGDPIEEEIFWKRRAEMIDDVYNTHIIKDFNRFIYDLSSNLSVQMNIANKVLDIEISDANTEAKHRKMNILKDDGYSWYLIESDISTFKANATNDYLRPVLKYLKLWLGRKNFR